MEERRKEGRIRRSRVGGYGVTRCKKGLLPLLVSRFLPYSLSLWRAPSLPERFSFPLAFRSFEVERGTRTEEWSKQKMRVPFGPSCLSPFARREGWNERARTWTNHRRVRSGRDGEEREAKQRISNETETEGEERPRETEREDERALPPRSKQKL